MNIIKINFKNKIKYSLIWRNQSWQRKPWGCYCQIHLQHSLCKQWSAGRLRCKGYSYLTLGEVWFWINEIQSVQSRRLEPFGGRDMQPCLYLSSSTQGWKCTMCTTSCNGLPISLPQIPTLKLSTSTRWYSEVCVRGIVMSRATANMNPISNLETKVQTKVHPLQAKKLHIYFTNVCWISKEVVSNVI